MEYLIIFFAVVTILLIAALAALIFILCKRNEIWPNYDWNFLLYLMNY